MVGRFELNRMVFSRLRQLLPWRTPLYSLPLPENIAPKSIFIRHVDGGSSNATEQEIIALFNPIYDLERLGFRLTASPRHADILLVSGPITRSMLSPLLAAFRAMPEPRRVVTVGNGFDGEWPFTNSYAIAPLPAELAVARVGHIPGDPPSPKQIMELLLRLDTLLTYS